MVSEQGGGERNSELGDHAFRTSSSRQDDRELSGQIRNSDQGWCKIPFELQRLSLRDRRQGRLSCQGAVRLSGCGLRDCGGTGVPVDLASTLPDNQFGSDRLFLRRDEEDRSS